MGETEKKRLYELLLKRHDTIHETLQVLGSSLPGYQVQETWDDVIKLGEDIHKQAADVKMLWTGEGPDAKVLEESIEKYSNMLEKLLSVAEDLMVAARTSLTYEIKASLEDVVNCSYRLLKESVACYGNISQAQLSIPKILDDVSKACSSLKETPRTNIAATRLSMIRIGSSINDVLRKLKKRMPASSGPSDEGDNSIAKLSATKTKNNELAIGVVSGTLSIMRETIHSVTGLFKNLQREREIDKAVESLEDLLGTMKEMKSLVDDIKDGLDDYPQDVSAIRTASEEMVSLVGELQEQLEGIDGVSAAFADASSGLKKSVKQLELELVCPVDDDDKDDVYDDDDDDDDADDELVSEMKKL